MYQYRVFLKRGLTEAVTPEKPIGFLTQAYKGEKVILPQHSKKIWGMPKWVLNQGTWLVEEVIHQIESAVEKADILILVPASDSLKEIV